MKRGVPQKDNKSNKFTYTVDGRTVTFSGDFDSGNLEKVQQYYGSPRQYKIWPGLDSTEQSSTKTFFHFLVSGFQSTKVRFRISNLSILTPMAKCQKIHLYRPVYKTNLMDEYQRIPTPVKSSSNPEKLQVIFQYSFGKEEFVYFAFAYPYSYQRSKEFTAALYNQLQFDEDIYFHKQTLILSNQDRELELITVTNTYNCLKERESVIDGLFPYAYDKRPFKIQPLPKILITARVHPGQSPSSYCFEGLLKFLTSKDDYRAHLLRKKFHFILIPMLNPDGVYQGMFRWDPVTRQDLNRVYTKCSQKQQPTIWAVKQYIQKCLKRVDFYFDLHSHASLKHFFVYGNSFDSIVHQTQTQLFARVLKINSPFFSVEECNFNKEEEETKGGCARFYLMKKYRIIHSYTIECGYHSPEMENELVVPKNSSIIYDGVYKMVEQSETKAGFYNIQSYMNLGKAVLVSILDIVRCNPYSRIGIHSITSLEQIRKEIANDLYRRDDRLRMSDPFITKNIKNINQLCNKYYSSLIKQPQKVVTKTRLTLKSSNPYINKTLTDPQPNRSKVVSRSVNIKSLSAHNIKQLEMEVYHKMPSLTESTRANDIISIQNVSFSSRLPNKTVENERLIARMKKVEENKKEPDSLKLLPIKESEYLLDIIQQRLDMSTRLHKGYVPFSLPSIKVKEKLKKDPLKFPKKMPNMSPSPI